MMTFFFFFCLNKQLFGFYNLNLVFFFLHVSTLVSEALDWALSASERRKRLCVKAVGRGKVQCDSRMADRAGAGHCCSVGLAGNASYILLRVSV